MRVLFFLPSLQAYQDRLQLVLEVANRVERLVLLVGKDDLGIESHSQPNFRIVSADYRRRLWPWNAWRASRIAERLIRQEGIHIVHDTFGNLLPLYRKRRRFPETRFVTSLFSLSAWRWRNVLRASGTALPRPQPARVLLNRWMERGICQSADCVVVQAPGLVDRLLEDVPVPRSRIHVLPNNVNTNFWVPAVAPSGDRVPQLLFVGNFYPGKGMPQVLEPLRILKQQGQPCRLRAVGRWVPGHRAEIQEAIRRMDLADRVQFEEPMPREALRSLYQNSDLLLYQTRDDGSPRVVLEALACGLPVVASRHPGIDHMDPDGQFIAFTEFGDAERIAECVLDCRRNRAQWLERSRRGRAAVLRRFSSSAVADSYVNFYRSLLPDRSDTMAGPTEDRQPPAPAG